MATSDQNVASTFLQSSTLSEFQPQMESWKMWKDKLEMHFSEINCSTEQAKKRILLKCIGAPQYSFLYDLCTPDSPASKTYKELCEILDTHYTPPSIVFRERKIFHNAAKEDEETVSQWYGRIKRLAAKCEFGSHFDIMVLDQFVISLPNKIFDRICEERSNITLHDALTKAMIMESKLSTSQVGSSADSSVNFVKKYPARNNTTRNTKQGNDTSQNKTKGKSKCTRCGWRNHEAKDCKYKNSTCHICSKIGHLASVCRSKQKGVINYISDSENNNSSISDLFNYSIYSVNGSNFSDVYALPVVVNGKEMNIACDTGAPCTLFPASLYNNFFKNTFLTPCLKPYVDYNGKQIKVLGEFEASITYRDVTRKIPIVVSNTNSPPLLGRTFLKEFNFQLTQVNYISNIEQYSSITDNIKKEYSDVFSEELGKFNGPTIDLQLSNDAKPIFHKPRSLPIAWKDDIEKQLRSLMRSGVLELVDSSEWGTPIVPIPKSDGTFRICGDYKVTINKFLVDVRYPLPRIDEIFTSLEGGELFTKLDLANAYNQLVLSDSSQGICALSTHIGTLKVKRMPFGIKPAAAIFQKTIENLLRGIPNVVIYQDDITVTGKDLQDHIKNLKAVLDKLKTSNLKLNASKCKFFEKEISYLGFTINKNGLRKTHERVVNILEAPIPKNVSEVRAFVGMVNHYSRFIESFADKIMPLYELLKKNVTYQWTSKCQAAYELMKKEVTSEQVLVHFNSELPLILSTDASNVAIAGILSHKFPNNTTKPIAFISRALSKSERNYSTLEKEALAIIFSVTKLKQYLLGNHFVLRTDHKPLITIFGENKGLPVMAASRMQRWAFILTGFNYSIEHVKGSMNEADALSRIPQLTTQQDILENSYVNFIEGSNYLNINFKHIAQETKRDPILSKLSHAILSGSLSNITDPNFKPFKNKANELTVDYGCILWGYRVLVPKKYQGQILNELHTSHMGIVKTKALARSYVWWPNLNSDLENLVKSCEPCQRLQSSPEKAALISWKPTGSAWNRIHIDFAGPIKGYYLFIIIDSFTKWVEVFKTSDVSSKFVITKLRETFSRYGIVETLVSDNGRQFCSDDFKTFLKINNVQHVLTAPGHPATNGQAEIFVKNLKKSLYASIGKDNNIDFDTILNRFLFDYRNTPHTTTGETPAKLFLKRSVKTRFDMLKPPLVDAHILKRQRNSENNYKGKRNECFSDGQHVFIRDYRNPNKKSWMPAKIKKQLGPRTYSCFIDHNNRLIKRHLNQIRSGTTVNFPTAYTGCGDVEEAGETKTEINSPTEVERETEDGVEILSDDSPVGLDTHTRPDRITQSSIELRPRINGKVVTARK